MPVTTIKDKKGRELELELGDVYGRISREEGKGKFIQVYYNLKKKRKGKNGKD